MKVKKEDTGVVMSVDIAPWWANYVKCNFLLATNVFRIYKYNNLI